MANKGGALANIGQALSGYGSALSGNPMFLQNSLIMRQMQDQRRQQEQEQRQNQVGNAAAMSFLRTQGMEGTPETKQFQVNGKTYGQNAPATKMGDPLSMFSKFAGGGTPLQSIAAQRAIGQLFPQAKPPLVLSEGERALDPTTFRELASNPRKERADPVRTQKITDAMELYNLSREDATKLADGVNRVVANPFDGSTFMVDMATGTRRPLRTSGGEEQLRQPELDTVTHPILGDVQFYGPAGRVPEALEKGTAGMFEASPEVLQARQRQRILRETLLDAFARSGRPSNYAQQRVEELLPSMGLFESPARAHDAFTTIRQDLLMQAQEDKAIAGDESLPVAMRQEAAARQRAAARAVRLIGDPERTPRPGATGGSGGAGGGVNAPQAAIEYLRSNPQTKAQFDAKYGAGSADRILGK